MTVLILLLLSHLGAREASYAGARIAGSPTLGKEISAIAWRESRHTRVGIHKGDSWASGTAYKRALAKGYISPLCPVWGPPKEYGVRGAHGLMSAYHLRYLPIPCLPPQVFDIPVVSAYAAAKKAQDICKRYGACTKQERHLIWRSVKAWRNR